MIPRGTTSIVGYRFHKVHVEDMVEAWLTLKQGGLVMNKTLSEAEIDTENNMLKWGLTQEETLEFDANLWIEKQVRYKLASGTAGISKVTRTQSYRLLRDGVI